EPHSLDEQLGNIGLDHRLNEKDNEKQNDRGNVDATHVWQQAADRAQRRLGEAIEQFGDHVHDRISRIDDIERDQPAQDRHGNKKIDVNCKQIRDELRKLVLCPASA